METIMVTAATLVAAVVSVELDKLVPILLILQLCSCCTQFPSYSSTRVLNLVQVLTNTTSYNFARRTRALLSRARSADPSPAAAAPAAARRRAAAACRPSLTRARCRRSIVMHVVIYARAVPSGQRLTPKT